MENTKSKTPNTFLVIILSFLIIIGTISMSVYRNFSTDKEYFYIKSENKIEYASLSNKQSVIDRTYKDSKDTILKYLDSKYPNQKGKFNIEYISFKNKPKDEYAPNISAIVTHKDYPNYPFSVDSYSLTSNSKFKEKDITELFFD